jgi:peptidoglycan/LPS O-acetylase OafA/YrhL
MRGIAAIIVVLDHMHWKLGHMHASGAHLAVDFFYVLSGVVIAGAYRSKLLEGLSVRRFLELRILRLYPLFAVGAIIGMVAAIGKTWLGLPDAMDASELTMALAANVLILPAPFLTYGLFPLNVPTWSLFFEIVLNILYATVVIRLNERFRLYLTILSAAFFAYGVLHFNFANLGTTWSTFAFGFARASFSFSLGVLLQSKLQNRSVSNAAFAPIFFLAIILLMPAPGNTRIAIDLFSAFLLLPALVLLGSRYELPPSLWGSASLLGRISYPLYAIHFPLLAIIIHARNTLLPGPDWILAVASTIGLLVLAWAIGKFYDVPLRSKLTAALHNRLSSPAADSPAAFRRVSA